MLEKKVAEEFKKLAKKNKITQTELINYFLNPPKKEPVGITGQDTVIDYKMIAGKMDNIF